MKIDLSGLSRTELDELCKAVIRESDRRDGLEIEQIWDEVISAVTKFLNKNGELAVHVEDKTTGKDIDLWFDNVSELIEDVGIFNIEIS